MRSKQTTIPTLRQTQGQARLSVAYRATARNVHASACPEVLSLTNDRKASKFKGISLCIALNSFERKKSPTSNTGGMNLQNTPPCGFNRFPLDKLTDRLNRLSVFLSLVKNFSTKRLLLFYLFLFYLV